MAQAYFMGLNSGLYIYGMSLIVHGIVGDDSLLYEPEATPTSHCLTELKQTQFSSPKNKLPL